MALMMRDKNGKTPEIGAWGALTGKGAMRVVHNGKGTALEKMDGTRVVGISSAVGAKEEKPKLIEEQKRESEECIGTWRQQERIGREIMEKVGRMKIPVPTREEKERWLSELASKIGPNSHSC